MGEGVRGSNWGWLEARRARLQAQPGWGYHDFSFKIISFYRFLCIILVFLQTIKLLYYVSILYTITIRSETWVSTTYSYFLHDARAVLICQEKTERIMVQYSL